MKARQLDNRMKNIMVDPYDTTDNGWFCMTERFRF